jgi:hypothetical protein
MGRTAFEREDAFRGGRHDSGAEDAQAGHAPGLYYSASISWAKFSQVSTTCCSMTRWCSFATRMASRRASSAFILHSGAVRVVERDVDAIRGSIVQPNTPTGYAVQCFKVFVTGLIRLVPQRVKDFLISVSRRESYCIRVGREQIQGVLSMNLKALLLTAAFIGAIAVAASAHSTS